MRDEELHLVFIEPPVDLQVVEQFSSSNVVHNEIHPVILLEDVVHLYNEGVINFKHDQLFKLRTLYHIFLQQILLKEALNCIVALSLRKECQEYTAKGSVSQKLYDLEVFKGNAITTRHCLTRAISQLCRGEKSLTLLFV